MNFRFLQLDLEWPQGLLHHQLRAFVLEQIRSYGEPVRWAITDLDGAKTIPIMKLEAVVLVVDS